MTTHTREDEQKWQLDQRKIEMRLQANLQILSLLADYFKLNPEYRFGQALYNLNIATHLACYDSNVGEFHKDIFYGESDDLLDRLVLSLNKDFRDEFNNRIKDYEAESKVSYTEGVETVIDNVNPIDLNNLLQEKED